MRSHHIAAAACAALLSLPAAAQLKPGLWEITSKIGGNAQMDQAMAQMQQQLAAMPPEQRKQMEAMMAQRGVTLPGAAPGGGMAMKVCMTKEQVEKNDVPMQNGCVITKNQKSGNVTQVAFTCSNPPSSGEGQYTHMGPEAFSSRMTIRTQVQGKPETMTSEGSGKWLGTNCGSVAPMTMPKQ